MLAYRKWVLSIGIAAATPGIALAGPFPFFKSDQSVPQSAAVNNQKLAEEAAANLRAARFSGFDIEIEVQNGVCVLQGKIGDETQKAQATSVISRVRGIKSVDNRLVVLNDSGKSNQTPQKEYPVQQAVAEDVTSNPIQQTGLFSRPRQTDPEDSRQQLAQGQPTYPSESIQQVQQVTSSIAGAIRNSGVRGHDIDLRYGNGVATLIGTANSPQDVARLTQVISGVPGVRQVDNRLQVPGMAPAGQPGNANQRVAEQIAQALAANQLSGLDIEVRYNGGLATLSGPVPHPQVVMIAHQVAASVPGVLQVDNRLTVPGMQPGMQPGMAQGMPPGMHPGMHPGMQGPGQQPSSIMPVSHQNSFGGNPAMMAAGAMGGAMGMGPGMGPGAGPHAHGAGNPSHLAYDLPNLPNHAWPTYTPYPNYAQLSYPKEYSASAWPYIGPFYPYPQVPLGWRQVQLEWDDGAWNLNFRPRTDKWFWYLDPKNW
ncbi:MAG: BON domain-containing protein [Planctomycetota bacterium]|nr:BON domain-containing protein [Planctomycetota bacterium]